MNRSAIIATGRYLGETEFTVPQMLTRLGLDPANPPTEWAQKEMHKTHRVRRKALQPGTSTSTLFVEAGKAALKKAGLKAEQLDLLICVTDTPDFICPSTASRVQFELGAKRAGFFDLNSSCAGFTIALGQADAFLRVNEDIHYVMIIGGNHYTPFLAPDDLMANMLFGDGAGAVIMARTQRPDRGLQKTYATGDGSNWNYWGVFAGGSWKGFTPEAIQAGFHHLKLMRPYETGLNVNRWPPVILEVLKRSGWNVQDVERTYMTQSRRHTIPHVCDVVGWRRDISYDTADKYGYLGSACIPVALDDALENGVLVDGQKLLILTSGVGYSISAATLIWGR